MRAEMSGGGSPREVTNKVQPTESARTPGGKSLGRDVPRAGIADSARTPHGKYTPRESRVRSTGETTTPDGPTLGSLKAGGRTGLAAWGRDIEPHIVNIVKAGGITDSERVQDVVKNVWRTFHRTLRDTGSADDMNMSDFMAAHTQAHVDSARTGEPFDPRTVAEQFVERVEANDSDAPSVHDSAKEVFQASAVPAARDANLDGESDDRVKEEVGTTLPQQRVVSDGEEGTLRAPDVVRDANLDGESDDRGEMGVRAILPRQRATTDGEDDGMRDASDPGVNTETKKKLDRKSRQIVQRTRSDIEIDASVNRFQEADEAEKPKLENNVLSLIKPQVERIVRTTVGRDFSGEHDDLVQEVLWAVHKALPTYEDKGKPFMNFVYGIVVHKHVDLLRRRGRKPEVPTELFGDGSHPFNVHDGKTPEQQVIDRERAAHARDLIAPLSPKERTIVILRLVEGLSAQETADIVGTTAGAVRIAQHRALDKVRRRVAQNRETEAQPKTAEEDRVGDRVLELHANGRSQREIARNLGVSREAVTNNINPHKQNSDNASTNRQIILEDDILSKIPKKYREPLELYHNGWSQQTIANELGRSQPTISIHVNRGYALYSQLSQQNDGQ